MLCQTRKQSSSFFILTGTLVDFSYHPQLMAGVGFLFIKRRKMHGILFYRLEKS